MHDLYQNSLVNIITTTTEKKRAHSRTERLTYLYRRCFASTILCVIRRDSDDDGGLLGDNDEEDDDNDTNLFGYKRKAADDS